MEKQACGLCHKGNVNHDELVLYHIGIIEIQNANTKCGKDVKHQEFSSFVGGNTK